MTILEISASVVFGIVLFLIVIDISVIILDILDNWRGM